MIRPLVLLFTLILSASQAAAEPARVTVFAAASLGGVLQEIAEVYAGEVTFSFGGSGVIARQVAAGAPADLVVLADPIWMKWLSNQNRIQFEGSANVASNALVVIGPTGAAAMMPTHLIARLDGFRLAMGHRDAVPAGSYGRAWLQSAGLWEALKSRLAETDNVRAALALVARGDAPLGIVYATDAQAEPRVQVVYAVPSDSHDAIIYPAAALTLAGADFLTHLQSAAALDIFAAHGFGTNIP
jgi:molybdate transport system substrate-binding protein